MRLEEIFPHKTLSTVENAQILTMASEIGLSNNELSWELNGEILYIKIYPHNYPCWEFTRKPAEKTGAVTIVKNFPNNTRRALYRMGLFGKDVVDVKVICDDGVGKYDGMSVDYISKHSAWNVGEGMFELSIPQEKEKNYSKNDIRFYMTSKKKTHYDLLLFCKDYYFPLSPYETIYNKRYFPVDDVHLENVFSKVDLGDVIYTRTNNTDKVWDRCVVVAKMAHYHSNRIVTSLDNGAPHILTSLSAYDGCYIALFSCNKRIMRGYKKRIREIRLDANEE